MLPALHLPTTVPTEGFWDRFDSDYQKNKAEFGEDNARRWRLMKKFIKYKQHSNLEWALHGAGKIVYEDLFSLRMYFKGKLTTLLEMANYYVVYHDEQTSTDIYNDLETWSQEYYKSGGPRPPAAQSIRDDENSDNADNRPIQPYFVDVKTRKEIEKRRGYNSYR